MYIERKGEGKRGIMKSSVTERDVWRVGIYPFPLYSIGYDRDTID